MELQITQKLWSKISDLELFSGNEVIENMITHWIYKYLIRPSEQKFNYSHSQLSRPSSNFAALGLGRIFFAPDDDGGEGDGDASIIGAVRDTTARRFSTGPSFKWMHGVCRGYGEMLT